MEETGQSDTIELGGNIELTGLREIDSGTMIILKKIIGNFVKQFTEANSKFEKIKLTLKPVHKTESSSKFEVKAQVIVDSKDYEAEITDRNLFLVIDKVLKKIEASV